MHCMHLTTLSHNYAEFIIHVPSAISIHMPLCTSQHINHKTRILLAVTVIVSIKQPLLNLLIKYIVRNRTHH